MEMTFTPALSPPAGSDRQRRWFVFRDRQILVESVGGNGLRPCLTDISTVEASLLRKQYLGNLDGVDCYAAELDAGAALPAGTTLHGLRQLFGSVDETLMAVAGRANQFVDWARTHQFCGRCGQPTRDKDDERAKICPACGLVNYPRVSPAIIVAVLKGDRILLARSTRARNSFYSVLAGFVEPGETLEDCVRREVREEVGIAVEDIRYFGSQPWPFPNALMVGFTAAYAGGELTVAPSEIVDAGWFAADRLPPLPGKHSIARRLIDWFVTRPGEAPGKV